MPRYHCLDTEIQLCTWDPVSCQSVFLDSSVLATRDSATDSHSTFTSRSKAPKDASTVHKGVSPCKHDRSHNLKILTEEYFKEDEGLNFLGYDTPFFLIHAGKELSSNKRSAKPWNFTKNSLYQDHKVSLESSAEVIATLFHSRSFTTEKATTDVPCLNSIANESHHYQNDSNGVYLPSDGSPLSSISSAVSISPHSRDLRKEPKGETGRQSFVTPKIHKVTANNLRTSSGAPKLEISTKPIQIIVKLSEKSFISPIHGTDSNQYDLCINVFYNGEFNTSHVVEYSTWAADKSKTHFSFGGRRIGSCHELPWMIAIKSEDTHDTMSQFGKHEVSLPPLERWNKLAEMLILEANEWGRDERGCRCPTGEYLEFLSRKGMPSELDSPLVITGSGSGVIDVVITLGRVFHHDAAKEITSPRRNLPSSLLQDTVMPVGSRIATPSQATVLDLSTDLSVPQFLGNLGSFAMEVDHEDTPRSSSKTDTPNAIATLSHGEGQNNSCALGVKTHGLGVTIHSLGSQEVVRRGTFMSAGNPTVPASAPTPRPPHPYRPQNVPQKTYRGSAPILPPSPPLKRQKTATLFEDLPFDLNTAAYMSTRARRSASTPFTQTSPKPQPEISAKRKRNMNQVKCTPSKADSSEKSMSVYPLTPQKDKMNNPKTPDSCGPLKKKSRSSNYNPKLSNRPQNLRRKNSVGEWVIPPSHRNSFGEWETPTKGDQVKAGSFLGEHAHRAATEEDGKIIQPNFTSSLEDNSRDMAVVACTADRAPPNRDDIISKANINPGSSAEIANRLALIVAGTEIKKEDVYPSDSLGQSKEVAITVAVNKLTSSPLAVTYQGAETTHTPVKGNPNRDLLATSQTSTGAIAFEGYSRRRKMNDTVGVSKNRRQKRRLRMRFFQANINSDGKIVGDGCGNRRWLVRRCVTPENIPSPGSGEAPASDLLFERKLKCSAFATGPKAEKVTNVLTDSATARPRRKSGTGNVADLGASNNLVTAALRDGGVDIPTKLQLPAVTQPRPRFVASNHKSMVLKLVNRKQVSIEMDGIKQEARGPTVEDAAKHFDGMHTSDLPVLATQDELQHNSRQDTRLKPSSTPQSVHPEHVVLLDGSATVLVQKEDPLRSKNSKEQIIKEDQASPQMPFIGKVPKRLIRPRTVGSIELKALLESHDCHNVVNTSGAPLGMIHSQPMTRASRKAISFKPHEVISTGEAVAGTWLSSDNPIIRIAGMGNSDPNKRSSSEKFIDRTRVSAIVPEHMKNAAGGTSKAMDAHNGREKNSGAPSFKVKKPSLTTHRNSTLNPSLTDNLGYNFSLLGTEELPLTDIPTAQTVEKTVLRHQKFLKIPKEAILDILGQSAKSVDKLETSIDHSNVASVDYPSLHGRNVKEDALQTNTKQAINLKGATGEDSVALKQVCKAKTEISNVSGHFESLTARPSAQRKFHNVAAPYTGRAEMSHAKSAEEPVTDTHGTQLQKRAVLSEWSHGFNRWKPGCLCDDSILTYAGDEDWAGLERNPENGQMCRRVGIQADGYFKAVGVLMGVRYVVVGSGVIKE